MTLLKTRKAGEDHMLVEQTFDDRDLLLAVQRGVLALVVVVAGLGVGAGLNDRFSILRATAFVISLVVLTGCSVLRVVQRRRAVLPWSWVIGPVPVLLAAIGVAVAVSAHPLQSVIGPYTRYSGAAMYAMYVGLMIFILRCQSATTLAQLARLATVVLGVVVAYGLLQFAGLDPVEWPRAQAGSAGDLPMEFATFGNVNFASGFVGLSAPLAAWAALAGGRAGWQRCAAAAVCAAATTYLGLIGSAQGILAYAAGMGLVGAVWLIGRIEGSWDGLRRRAFVSAAVVFVFASVAIPFVAAFVRRQLDDAGARERRQLWDTAMELWSDRPLLGHGLGSFEWLFSANRPPEHATQNNFLQADAPHNVVLDMAVGGGALLAVAYLAFVLFVGIALVRGLRRLRGEDRMLLAGFGGAWLGYQVQSLVSLDVPPVAVMHWLLAGAVIVIASPPRAVVFGTAPAAVAHAGVSAPRRSGRGAARSRAARSPGVDWRATVAVGAVAIALLWPVTIPLRADRASALAGEARQRGDEVAELRHAERAASLAPWEARYWAQKAAASAQVGDLVKAREAGLEAAERASGSSIYALAAAGLAVRLDDPVQAEQWLEEALRRDPHNPEVIAAVERTRALLADGGEPP